MTQKPSNAFIAASWIALGAGMIGFLIGLYRAEMALNEKGYYFTVLMFGLFAVISVQKSVRDRLEGVPVTDIYYGLSWFSTILSIILLVVGLWNATLLPSEKGFYAFAFMLALFGAIAVGGTLGAIFGPWLASQLAKPFGTPVLLLVAAGFLLLALAAAWWITRLRPEVAQSGAAREEHAVIGGSAWQGLRSVARSPYLLAICGYVLILAVMVTFLYFTRLQMVAALGTDVDMRTTMFANIDLITQVTTLVLQLIVTGHLMKRLGVPMTLALLPLTAVLGFVGLAIVGSLAALIGFEAAFRAVQRGVMRPARETLFTVVPRADRYKAKAFIDTFVYRTGDLVGAQTEGLLGRLGMGLGALASVALPLAAAWMALGLWLGRAQRARANVTEAQPEGMPA